MKITVNDVTIHYEKSGNGKPLLLLHGNGEDHHIFDKLAAKLKNHYTIYAIDSRNHGESEKTDLFSYETMREDMFAFIEALNLEQVSLLGFSDGAIIGLMMAIEDQSVFDKLVLLGVNLKPTDFRDKIYDIIWKNYNETKDPLLKLMLDEPNIELGDVRDIHTETLIIAAEKEVFKLETYTNLVNTMPNAKLKIIPGHKHETYIQDNDMLYEDLVRFL
ncbi:alpha/beta hydrolase [Bacteroidales bacterium OttesenSCG-928-B11]|nr:alpha/beta hydrolase [Bacteroidales bacterium OttesenSCG-928-B11]MDL2326055.1 alpha/beta hydrolase [Bacteroidales bacterium OttesenSCG-928-A14]